MVMHDIKGIRNIAPFFTSKISKEWQQALLMNTTFYHEILKSTVYLMLSLQLELVTRIYEMRST